MPAKFYKLVRTIIRPLDSAIPSQRVFLAVPVSPTERLLFEDPDVYPGA